MAPETKGASPCRRFSGSRSQVPSAHSPAMASTDSSAAGDQGFPFATLAINLQRLVSARSRGHRAGGSTRLAGVAPDELDPRLPRCLHDLLDPLLRELPPARERRRRSRAREPARQRRRRRRRGLRGGRRRPCALSRGEDGALRGCEGQSRVPVRRGLGRVPDGCARNYVRLGQGGGERAIGAIDEGLSLGCRAMAGAPRSHVRGLSLGRAPYGHAPRASRAMASAPLEPCPRDCPSAMSQGLSLGHIPYGHAREGDEARLS